MGGGMPIHKVGGMLELRNGGCVAHVFETATAHEFPAPILPCRPIVGDGKAAHGITDERFESAAVFQNFPAQLVNGHAPHARMVHRCEQTS